MSTPEPPVPTGPRAVPRRFVIGGVVVAAVISWIGTGFVSWNAWRTAFQDGHVRIESAAGLYMVLALLATALAALPFTFLQWVDPEQKQRWRTVGGAIGLVGCGLFLLLWLTG
jgi:Na+/melibiose symporter-like transporter